MLFLAYFLKEGCIIFAHMLPLSDFWMTDSWLMTKFGSTSKKDNLQFILTHYVKYSEIFSNIPWSKMYWLTVVLVKKFIWVFSHKWVWKIQNQLCQPDIYMFVFLVNLVQRENSPTYHLGNFTKGGWSFHCIHGDPKEWLEGNKNLIVVLVDGESQANEIGLSIWFRGFRFLPYTEKGVSLTIAGAWLEVGAVTYLLDGAKTVGVQAMALLISSLKGIWAAGLWLCTKEPVIKS